MSHPGTRLLRRLRCEVLGHRGEHDLAILATLCDRCGELICDEDVADGIHVPARRHGEWRWSPLSWGWGRS